MPIFWPCFVAVAYVVVGIITEEILIDTNYWPYENDMIVAAWPIVWLYYGAKHLLRWLLRCMGLRIVWR